MFSSKVLKNSCGSQVKRDSCHHHLARQTAGQTRPTSVTEVVQAILAQRGCAMQQVSQPLSTLLCSTLVAVLRELQPTTFSVQFFQRVPQAQITLGFSSWAMESGAARRHFDSTTCHGILEYEFGSAAGAGRAAARHAPGLAHHLQSKCVESECSVPAGPGSYPDAGSGFRFSGRDRARS